MPWKFCLLEETRASGLFARKTSTNMCASFVTLIRSAAFVANTEVISTRYVASIPKGHVLVKTGDEMRACRKIPGARDRNRTGTLPLG